MTPDIKYPFEIRPLADDEGGGWLIAFPDLPGCMSDGETPEEAMANGRDALAAWLTAARRGGQGGIDLRHVTASFSRTIKTFADRDTQELYRSGRTQRLPPDIARGAARKLECQELAMRVDDLRVDDLKVPPGNRLHALTGDRSGQYSISINDQWRVCCRFENGDAYDVEICDYH